MSLAALGKFAVQRGVQSCESILTSNSADRIGNLLRPVHGVGPGEVLLRTNSKLLGIIQISQPAAPGWRAPKDWVGYPIPIEDLQSEPAPGMPPPESETTSA